MFTAGSVGLRQQLGQQGADQAEKGAGRRPVPLTVFDQAVMFCLPDQLLPVDPGIVNGGCDHGFLLDDF
jgi:hypothetical protein